MSEAVQSPSSDSAPNKLDRRSPMSIAGVGAVTGYGWGKKHLWDGFLLGRERGQADHRPRWLRRGGQAYLSLITDEGDRHDGPSRFMQALRFAAREAITDALERGWKPGPVVGVVHSLEKGDIDMWSEFYQSGESRVRAKRWVNMMPSTVISQMMKENDFHGPTMSVSAMCASANAAMITAKSWLDSGIASDVILLATDLSGMPPGAAGLQRPRRGYPRHPAVRRLPSLSRGQPGLRRWRGGGGHGAVQRTRAAYASVLGGAMTMDAYNLVGVAPDLQEMFRCFRDAIANAGAEPEDVAYINAHGPGTANATRPRRRSSTSSSRIRAASFGKAVDRALPIGGRGSGDLGHHIRLPDRVRSRSAAGGPRPSQAGRRPDPAGAGADGEVTIGMGGYNTVMVIAEPDE